MRHPLRLPQLWGCTLEHIAIAIIITVVWSSSALFLAAEGQQQQQQQPSTLLPVTVDAFGACRDFRTLEGIPGLSSSQPSPSLSPSSWTLEDCLAVWTQFVDTIPPGQQQHRLKFVDLWKETAAELRRAGSPCLVNANPGDDGLGSSTLRHFASWVFAEEMGCDWVTPDWGKERVVLGAGGGEAGGNGTASAAVMYCHRTATLDEMDALAPSSNVQDKHRCAVVNWLAYFRFDAPSVGLPEGGTSKVIQVRS